MEFNLFMGHHYSVMRIWQSSYFCSNKCMWVMKDEPIIVNLVMLRNDKIRRCKTNSLIP